MKVFGVSDIGPLKPAMTLRLQKRVKDNMREGVGGGVRVDTSSPIHHCDGDSADRYYFAWAILITNPMFVRLSALVKHGVRVSRGVRPSQATIALWWVLG
jgi:hypothetical protein